jgi:hypoxanthine-DNA glycosylase
MIHSFEPIEDKNCRILILGTMPGRQSLEKNEYYANPRNVFWDIIFSLFGEPMTEDYEKKRRLLLLHGIALWDVLKNCRRDTSADSDIRDPVPNDLLSFFNDHPPIDNVFFNGKQAWELYRKNVLIQAIDQKLTYHRMTSTSPANASRSFEEKLKCWTMIKKYTR